MSKLPEAAICLRTKQESTWPGFRHSGFPILAEREFYLSPVTPSRCVGIAARAYPAVGHTGQVDGAQTDDYNRPCHTQYLKCRFEWASPGCSSDLLYFLCGSSSSHPRMSSSTVKAFQTALAAPVAYSDIWL